MTGGSEPSSAMTTAQRRLAYHRYAGEMARVRSIAWLALGLWIGVGLVMHLVLFPTIGHGAASTVLIALFAPCLGDGLLLYLLSRHPLPPERLMVPLGAANFIATTIALVFIASRTGGLTSPYHIVLVVILMVQVLALPRHWSQGAVVAVVTALICPIGTLVLSRHDAVLRAQLTRPEEVTRFVGLQLVLVAAVVVMTWGGHVLWSLRQSAFETKSIGRYRLLRRIGKGGMGEVWRAHDKAIRRDVALKILSPEHGRSPVGIARFEREIEATAGLSHSNTVRVHDWGVTPDGVWYYAMELLEGADLASLVRRRGRLPPALVVRLGVQAARAIAEAHARGIIHRDLKPANLFVVAIDGLADHVKVLDFGVARVDADDEGMTQTGAVLGTPGYIAPEVLAGAAAEPAADVWSLAATLFFALTGRSVRDAGGQPASALVGDVPRALDGVLVRALDADPTRRPATADGFAAELEATGVATTWTRGLRVDETLAPGAAGEDTLAAAGDRRHTVADAPAARDRRPTP